MSLNKGYAAPLRRHVRPPKKQTSKPKSDALILSLLDESDPARDTPFVGDSNTGSKLNLYKGLFPRAASDALGPLGNDAVATRQRLLRAFVENETNMPKNLNLPPVQKHEAISKGPSKKNNKISKPATSGSERTSSTTDSQKRAPVAPVKGKPATAPPLRITRGRGVSRKFGEKCLDRGHGDHRLTESEIADALALTDLSDVPKRNETKEDTRVGRKDKKRSVSRLGMSTKSELQQLVDGKHSKIGSKKISSRSSSKVASVRSTPDPRPRAPTPARKESLSMGSSSSSSELVDGELSVLRIVQHQAEREIRDRSKVLAHLSKEEPPNRDSITSTTASSVGESLVFTSNLLNLAPTSGVVSRDIMDESRVPLGAMKRKTFAIIGEAEYPLVRSELLRRGWTEKASIEEADIVWSRTDNESSYDDLEPWQLVSHFQSSHVELCSKIGLHRNLRAMKVVGGVNVDTFYPRSFALSDAEGIAGFANCYILHAAEAYVRNILDEWDQEFEFNKKHRVRNANIDMQEAAAAAAAAVDGSNGSTPRRGRRGGSMGVVAPSMNMNDDRTDGEHEKFPQSILGHNRRGEPLLERLERAFKMPEDNPHRQGWYGNQLHKFDVATRVIMRYASYICSNGGMTRRESVASLYGSPRFEQSRSLSPERSVWGSSGGRSPPRRATSPSRVFGHRIQHYLRQMQKNIEQPQPKTPRPPPYSREETIANARPRVDSGLSGDRKCYDNKPIRNLEWYDDPHFFGPEEREVFLSPSNDGNLNKLSSLVSSSVKMMRKKGGQESKESFVDRIRAAAEQVRYRIPQNDIEEVRSVIKAISHFDPQQAIRGKVDAWIVKPAAMSRGRGIICTRSIHEICNYARANKHDLVVQAYIARPMQVEERKMDMRVWVLVTNWNPLTIWVFNKPYFRVASEPFNIYNLENEFAHLCNWTIQRHGRFYDTNKHFPGNTMTLQSFVDMINDRLEQDKNIEYFSKNMANFAQTVDKAKKDSAVYQRFLMKKRRLAKLKMKNKEIKEEQERKWDDKEDPTGSETHHRTGSKNYDDSDSDDVDVKLDWDSDVQPQLNKIIVNALRSVQDRVVERKGCFELFGVDFMLDEDLTPWLIEMNGSPGMEHDSPATNEAIPEGVRGLFDVLFEAAYDESVSLHPGMEVGGWSLIHNKAVPRRDVLNYFWEKEETMGTWQGPNDNLVHYWPEEMMIDPKIPPQV